MLKSSDAPTLVKILSTTPMCADVAGTNEPIWAINVINATCLIYVDFPAMFGPVIIETLFDSLSRYVSFATNAPLGNIFSITGCLPSLMSIIPLSSTSGIQ